MLYLRDMSRWPNNSTIAGAIPENRYVAVTKQLNYCWSYPWKEICRGDQTTQLLLELSLKRDMSRWPNNSTIAGAIPEKRYVAVTKQLNYCWSYPWKEICRGDQTTQLLLELSLKRDMSRWPNNSTIAGAIPEKRYVAVTKQLNYCWSYPWKEICRGDQTTQLLLELSLKRDMLRWPNNSTIAGAIPEKRYVAVTKQLNYCWSYPWKEICRGDQTTQLLLELSLKIDMSRWPNNSTIAGAIPEKRYVAVTKQLNYCWSYPWKEICRGDQTTQLLLELSLKRDMSRWPNNSTIAGAIPEKRYVAVTKQLNYCWSYPWKEICRGDQTTQLLLELSLKRDMSRWPNNSTIAGAIPEKRYVAVTKQLNYCWSYPWKEICRGDQTTQLLLELSLKRDMSRWPNNSTIAGAIPEKRYVAVTKQLNYCWSYPWKEICRGDQTTQLLLELSLKRDMSRWPNNSTIAGAIPEKRYVAVTKQLNYCWSYPWKEICCGD